MVLAAGLGKRMRPITDTLPKPMVKIADKALIDWGLDSLERAGVKRAIANVHYLPDQLIEHLAARDRPEIIISDERDALLDSGGGIVRALPLLGETPFYILNADTFWIDRTEDNLRRIALAWDDGAMDILLMLATLDQATGHSGGTDFLRSPEGRLTRSKGAPDGLIYAGVAIVHPRIFADAPQGPHSLNVQFDKALKRPTGYGSSKNGRARALPFFVRRESSMW